MTKVVFFGTPKFVIPVLQVMTEDFEVVGVITTPDEKVGRQQIVTPTPVKDFTIRFTQIKNIFTPSEYTPDFIQQLKDLQADIFVVAAYGKILPQEVLDIPTKGSINIHPSLLPAYRGPSPIQATILDGLKSTGITFIKMDEEVDHGPILAQFHAPVQSTDTFDSLAVSLFAESAKQISTVISNYVHGTVETKEQDHSKATFTNHITKQDGFIDITSPPSTDIVNRIIRAYYPWPSAWTTLKLKDKNVRLKLLPNRMVQLEGKNAVDLETFLRGYPEIREDIEKLLGKK